MLIKLLNSSVTTFNIEYSFTTDNKDIYCLQILNKAVIKKGSSVHFISEDPGFLKTLESKCRGDFIRLEQSEVLKIAGFLSVIDNCVL